MVAEVEMGLTDDTKVINGFNSFDQDVIKEKMPGGCRDAFPGKSDRLTVLNVQSKEIGVTPIKERVKVILQ